MGCREFSVKRASYSPVLLIVENAGWLSIKASRMLVHRKFDFELKFPTHTLQYVIEFMVGVYERYVDHWSVSPTSLS